MNMTNGQAIEWAAYLGGDTSATPPAFALLGHWAECIEKGQTLSWGSDRGAAILAHIAELEAHVASLQETVTFNRKQAERVARRHGKEVAALRRELAEARAAEMVS